MQIFNGWLLYGRFMLLTSLVLFASTSALNAQNDSGFKFLEVKVLDTEGKPAPDVAVGVKIDGMEFPMPTDQDGKISLNVPSGGSRLELKVQEDGYVALGASWTKGEKMPTEFEISLKKGTSIGGIVHDEDGNPIEGVEVRGIIPMNNNYQTPNQQDLPKQLQPMLSGVIGTTDGEGRWINRSVPSNEFGLQIMFSHPDYVADRGYGFRGGNWAQLRSLENIVTLQKGIELRGKITDPDGEPVAGAQVQVGRDRWSGEKLKATSNDAGEYRIGNIPPGSNVVTITSNDWAPELLTVVSKRDMPPKDIQLKHGQTIQIRIVDPAGEPIEGVRITPWEWRGYQTIVDPFNRKTTDADGLWEWDGAPADIVNYSISKRDRISSRLSGNGLVARDEVHEVTMLPAVVVTGKVVDQETGKPVDKFQYVEGVWWEPNYGNPTLQSHNVKTSTDGTYRFVMTSGCEKFMVRVDAAGYKPATTRPIFPHEGEVTIDIELEAGTGPSGIVKTPNGDVAVDAQIAVAEANKGGIYLSNGQLQQHYQNQAATTSDENGKYALPVLASEKSRIICLHDDGYADLDGKLLEDSPDVTLTPWSKVTGKTLRGSEPLAGQQVTLYVGRDYRQGFPHVNWSYIAQTNASGEFAFDRVIAGTATISRIVPYAQTAQGHRMSSNSHNTQVEVGGGRTTSVTLGGTGRQVVGRLLIPAGNEGTVSWDMGIVQLRHEVKTVDAVGGLFYQLGQVLGQGRSVMPGRTNPNPSSTYASAITEAGEFEIYDVPPGQYKMTVKVHAQPEGRNFRWETVASLNQPVTIPEDTPEKEGEKKVQKMAQDSVDLGEFTVQMAKPTPSPTSTFEFEAIVPAPVQK